MNTIWCTWHETDFRNSYRAYDEKGEDLANREEGLEPESYIAFETWKMSTWVENLELWKCSCSSNAHSCLVQSNTDDMCMWQYTWPRTAMTVLHWQRGVTDMSTNNSRNRQRCPLRRNTFRLLEALLPWRGSSLSSKIGLFLRSTWRW